jgi:hypothetical protein
MGTRPIDDHLVGSITIERSIALDNLRRSAVPELSPGVPGLIDPGTDGGASGTAEPPWPDDPDCTCGREGQAGPLWYGVSGHRRREHSGA